MSQQQGYPEAEVTPDTRSMLVQEGDPPMGRPVILSKETTLLAQPPSASWGSAAGVTPTLQTTGVQTGSVTGVTSGAPMDTSTEVLQVCSSTPAAQFPFVYCRFISTLSHAAVLQCCLHCYCFA